MRDARFEESLKPARAGLNPFWLFVKESQTNTSEELSTVITFLEKKNLRRRRKSKFGFSPDRGQRTRVRQNRAFYYLADWFDWFW